MNDVSAAEGADAFRGKCLYRRLLVDGERARLRDGRGEEVTAKRLDTGVRRGFKCCGAAGDSQDESAEIFHVIDLEASVHSLSKRRSERRLTNTCQARRSSSSPSPVAGLIVALFSATHPKALSAS